MRDFFHLEYLCLTAEQNNLCGLKDQADSRNFEKILDKLNHTHFLSTIHIVNNESIPNMTEVHNGKINYMVYSEAI